MSRFLTDAVELLRQLCRDVTDPRDDEAVDLAAHLFAIACRIPRECGSATLSAVPEQARPLVTIPDVLMAIEKLTPPVEPRDLYWFAVRSLQAFEGDWSRPTFGRETLRPVTALRGHGACDLAGDVVHWLRPTPALGRLRNWRRLIHHGGPPRPAHHPTEGLRRLGMFWNVHQQWPRVEVRQPAERFQPPPLFSESGFAAIRRSFRIALCPLLAEAHPVFRLSGGGRFFRAHGPESIHGREALHAYLARILRSAAEEEVHLLVLPELNVDRATRRHLVEILRERSLEQASPGLGLPWGVVAGSYHVWGEDQDPKTAPPANESVVYDPRGTVVLRHQKRGRFEIARKHLELTRERLPEMFGAGEEAAVGPAIEEIVHDSRLEILETGLGRLAVAICADCIAPDQTCLEPLLRELRPDLLVIVSMTAETDLFEALLERLARNGIGSLFVNARCLCPPEGGQLLAAANLGLYEPPGTPPTRIRWCSGEEEVAEVRYYNPTDREKKRWCSVADVAGEVEPGVTWLGGPQARLGLVLSLGPHFGEDFPDS